MHMSTKIVLFVVTALWSSLEVTATPLLLKDGFNSGVLESRYNRDETATTSDDFGKTFIEYFLDKRGSDRTTIFYTAVPDDNDLNLVDDLVCAIGRGVLYSDVFPRAGIETALDWRHTLSTTKAVGSMFS
ncbi:hypothetical protein N7510_006741 [Penicillium lagena]|uniref:uncharacterized protein n=1 Tax=Penicillium lagena TaxID=94218 RepID=UPI00253F9D3D|nr:uncharacterized protein N7510_006741 [Penicillium lagena]KAJ5610022.1 hypothetical protein N7510_006741 [Penicillium lagena]